MKESFRILAALCMVTLAFMAMGCEVDTTQYSISVSINGSGTVTPSSGTFDEGTTVTLNAVPDTGWVFSDWTGDVNGTGTTIQIVMDSDKTVVANFTQTTGNNATINGTYSLLAVHSNKALDTWNWGTENGTNIAQYNYWGGDAQKFVITPVDGIWHKITPIISTGQAIDVANCSTDEEANIQTWSNQDNRCQQFRFQVEGNGAYRIINRSSEKCLSVLDGSYDDGANVVQASVVDGAQNQLFTLFAQADNPLFKNFHTADPSPFVYNGRYYIVCGQDQPNSSDFNMWSWHLLSSADMQTWTDHGVIARPSDIGWMPNNCAWASCIIYRNGYFYMYASGCNQIGVLRSRNITGPYEDVLGHALIDGDTIEPEPYNARDIDPMCFIDDDGQAYLFWGGDGICRYVRLNSDMTSLNGAVMDAYGFTDVDAGYVYLEAPFVIKENGTYFMIYADQPWPSKIRYATASSIHGPWTHRGVIGEPTGSGTNHAGAAFFNGRWWYTYHTEELSNENPYSRSVSVDPMTISGDTIMPILYTSFY